MDGQRLDYQVLNVILAQIVLGEYQLSVDAQRVQLGDRLVHQHSPSAIDHHVGSFLRHTPVLPVRNITVHSVRYLLLATHYLHIHYSTYSHQTVHALLLTLLLSVVAHFEAVHLNVQRMIHIVTDVIAIVPEIITLQALTE